MLALHEAWRDITLEEMRRELGQASVTVAISTLHRFFASYGITKDEQVVEVMARISLIRGTPPTIRVDNGPEFISKALDRWAYEIGVKLDFSWPGKPTDNASVESFNGRLRDEA